MVKLVQFSIMIHANQCTFITETEQDPFWGLHAKFISCQEAEWIDWT